MSRIPDSPQLLYPPGEFAALEQEIAALLAALPEGRSLGGDELALPRRRVWQAIQRELREERHEHSA